jgi:protein-S-isoprenylcysteine O-methyltransferase Ste14
MPPAGADKAARVSTITCEALIMNRPRVIPPVYLLVANVLLVATHFLLPLRQLMLGPSRLFGLIPFAAGVALMSWTIAKFRLTRTTIWPGEVSSRLMTDGPFRLSRNPIYIGMVLILAGQAVVLGSLGPWMILPLFVWMIRRNIIPVEEAMLCGTFGEAYRQYQGRVRRWM